MRDREHLKLCRQNWFPCPVGESGAPLLPGSLAQFECRRYTHYDGGDHVIFIGEVMHFRYEPAEAPLIFYRGRYRNLSAAS